MELRAKDGFDAVNAYRPRTTPGVYVQTMPTVAWEFAEMLPFVMTNPAQFLPPPPIALTSEQWARDYNEIKDLGAKNSTTRTPRQTEDAQFWFSAGPTIYQPIPRQIVISKNMSVVDSAHFMAVVATAKTDAYIAVFNAKYKYEFWRPITAIRNGDIDGNADTIHDPAWIPLIDKPMHPEYPCAHCITAAAVATVLKSEFGSGPIGPIAMTSPTAPGVTRTWHSIEDYVTDVKNARIWAGVHYRFSTEIGEAMGRKIGHLAVQNYMIPAAQ